MSNTKTMETEYGYKFGPATVERAYGDEKKGWVLILLKTAKHPDGIQLYVTKTGKVRVFSDGGEWFQSAPDRAAVAER
jgi:hypothetical protein